MDAREKTNLEFLSVQNKFIARRKEQDTFRASLRHILKTQSNTSSLTQPVSRLFLLNGPGGLGKTTLLNCFIQICREEDPASKSLVIKVDWDDYKIDENLEEPDKAIKAMDVLYDAFMPEYDSYFKEFRAKRERHEQISQEKAQAIQEFDGWVDFASELVAATPAGSLGKTAVKAIAKTAVPAIQEQYRRFSEWFRHKLHPEDYDLYDDPKGQLSRLFVKGLLKVASDRPLVLMLDTAEHVLHVQWLRTGLTKYTLPETERLLLVIAGRISDPFQTSIRDTIPDSFIYRSDLATFRKFDIIDYLKVCLGYESEETIPSGLVDFILQTTQGMPLAVDSVVTALSRGYDWSHSDRMSESSSVDTEELIGRVAYRFLKHCLEDPKKLSDRDYIYTFAILSDEIKNISPVVEYIWKDVFGEHIRPTDVTVRLHREYSFLFSGGKMHPVVKLFVCSALSAEKIESGRLYEINEAAIAYFSTKHSSFKDHQLKFGIRSYQEAAIGYLNHLFWRGDIEEGLNFLCSVYNLSVLYGEFPFANRFLATITQNQWLRSRLPKEDDELLILLQYFGHLLGQYGQTSSNVARLKELIFDRFDGDTKALTRLNDAINFAKAGKLEQAAVAIKQAESLIIDDTFEEEMALAYRALGIAERRRGNLETALHYLDKAFSLKSDAYTLVEMGRAKSQQHLNDEAIRDFSKALEIDPSLTFVRKEIEVLSQPPQSIRDRIQHEIQVCHMRLKKLASTDRSEAFYRIHSRIGVLLTVQGKLNEALREHLIAEEFNLACTYNKTSTAYLLLGQNESALQRVQKALEFGDDDPVTYLSSGDVYRAMGRLEDAQRAYELAIEVSMRHKEDENSASIQTEAHYCKGLTLLLRNELEAGRQSIEQAQRIIERVEHPRIVRYARVLNALGLSCLLTERPRRAADLFNPVIRLSDELISQSPSAYEAYYNKMIALAGLSRFDQAETLMEESLSHCKATGVVALALEKINLLAKSSQYSQKAVVLATWLQEYL